MTNWTQTLKEIICTPCCNMRPFVCDGYPDSCQVMVIGKDPATTLPDDWWSFWDPEYGFNEACFESAYLKHREQEQLTNPAKRLKSDTREKFLNRITNNLKPQLKSIETNASMGGGSTRYSNQEVIRVLLKEISDLQAIIAYGNEAHKLVQQSGKLRHLINLPDEAIYQIRHFRSRGKQAKTDRERCEEIDRICTEIKVRAIV